MSIAPSGFPPSDNNVRFESSFSDVGARRFLNDKDPEAARSRYFYLKNVAYRIVKPDLAYEIGYSDIVMNAIQVGLSKAGCFHGDSEGQLRSWLVGIMKNLNRRYRRDILRRKEYTINSNHTGDERGAEKIIAELVDARGRQPMDEASLRELAAILYKAIEQLPWRLEPVVKMHVYESLDFHTIAERLGMEKAAVEKRYRRAIAQLRDMHEIRRIMGLA